MNPKAPYLSLEKEKDHFFDALTYPLKRAREIRKFHVSVIFSNETLCKYCFSMSRDKILFVIKPQKLKKQQDTSNFRSAILHKEMNTSKCRKLILMTTGYFLRWRPSYHSFPGPPLSKMAAESNFPPWGRSGCQIPYPRTLQFPWVALAPSPILGQTIDRCIGTEHA